MTEIITDACPLPESLPAALASPLLIRLLTVASSSSILPPGATGLNQSHASFISASSSINHSFSTNFTTTYFVGKFLLRRVFNLFLFHPYSRPSKVYTLYKYTYHYVPWID